MINIKINIEKHFIYLFICILISTFILSICFKIKTDTQKKLAYTEIQFKNSERLFKSAAESLHQYFSYFPFIQSLKTEGIMGPENRLQWIEVLQKIAYEQKIPLIQYSIDPTHYLTEIQPEGASDTLSSMSAQPDQENSPLPESPLVISHSQMMLSFGLTHEQSLLSLLIGLEKSARAIPTVESCHLQYNPLEPHLMTEESSAIFSQITGECKMNWYTFIMQESFITAQ